MGEEVVLRMVGDDGTTTAKFFVCCEEINFLQSRLYLWGSRLELFLDM